MTDRPMSSVAVIRVALRAIHNGLAFDLFLIPFSEPTSPY